MAIRKVTDDRFAGLPTISPKTPEMEIFLQAGYPEMSVEKANTIIKERKENPSTWPYEEYEKAQRFLTAYNSAPVSVDTEPGWKRK